MVTMIRWIKDLWQMNDSLGRSRKALEHRRDILLRKRIENAYHNVPFYRRLYDTHKLAPSDIRSVGDLAKLPIITKKDIRRNQKDILNRDYPISNCYKSHTSGSTGEPTWTYFDRQAWYRKKYFSKLRARMACGMKLRQRVVILESEAVRKLRIKNQTVSKLFFLLPVKYLSIFESPEILLQQLIAFKPHNIYGPPSCLFAVAKKASRMGTRIAGLERVFTSSEYLADTVKSYLEETLGARVHDVYGSTETKELAWQCSEGKGYHINEDEAIVEIVDEHGHVLPPGQPGNIVVTDLCNRAMPLIRYRNHDKGLLMEPRCPCGIGFSLMQPLTGRASEHVLLPNGHRLSPFLFTTSIEKTKGLLQYQIIQECADALRVKTIFAQGDFDRGRESILKILADITKNMMAVEVEECDKIDLEKNGKFMVVKNEIAA